MPAHRKPIEELLATGADKIHPGRLKDRSDFSGLLPELGGPPRVATQRHKKLWAEFAAEFPWLQSTDRPAIYALCVMRARLEDEPEKCDARFFKQYLEYLKEYGGTPGQRTRMPKDKDEQAGGDDDPDGDEYVN